MALPTSTSENSTGLSLLILAAGMGSRFGGLKQLEPVGPSGETIIEYSVFDAIRAGFNKVVFVIRREFEDAFREQISRKFSSEIAIDFAYQEIESIPAPFKLPPDRIKPWGTGHAVLSAKQTLTQSFAVINADDFYGTGSFFEVARFLTSQHIKLWPPHFCIAGYRLDKTLSNYGAVSRGICSIDSNGFLTEVTEREKIKPGELGPAFESPDGKWVSLPASTRVSMNMMGFTPDLFPFLEEQFREFLEKSGTSLKSEFYLPAAVSMMIRRGQAKVKVLPVDDQWMGVTYPEDKADVREKIARLVEQGAYPRSLWDAL